ncbi:sodium/proton antiporter NhaB [Salinibius halmophilus]|uniref:sodium/proton antiporter NhaB n=1 Tax=Salinibius halmophilus TaxID=1853216 RepID=UPI000E674115|nr:sodium/proton antiporter NhaB [Salinibius halmophilus]
MPTTYQRAFTQNFLGNSPTWYKQAIIAFLIINPIAYFALGDAGGTVVGWMLIAQFIFTLAMALKCYPLQPGGLLAIQAVFIGLTDPYTVYHEVQGNIQVILLLMFMVAGIYFMKDLLLFIFTRILLGVRSKLVLSLIFSFMAAFLSAFLDALTVTAVLIAVTVGFYSVYHRVASGAESGRHDHSKDDKLQGDQRADLEQFRAFMRSLLMHGAVGTALGGVMTQVGEPQNLLIASKSGWDFLEFFLRMAPVTIPVFFAGLLTVIVLELTGWFGYGAKIPQSVYNILCDFQEKEDKKRTKRDIAKLVVQGFAAVFLIIALATHVAEVGLIGLAIIVIQTAFNGVTEEHQLGKAFEEALPFTALLVVFFTIVAVIHDQHLFSPVIEWVLALDESIQPAMFYMANGILSAISDNVFVATVYINEVVAALSNGVITQEQYDLLAVSINTGTNLPSVATPNGQAAFLFLLTSAIAPLVRLSYGRMVIMALPYTIVLTIVGLVGVMML